jgi:hypothetical protein
MERFFYVYAVDIYIIKLKNKDMKITIPVLDQYLDSCQSGAILFESFTESNPETISHIDAKLFEAYRDYKNESRVISLLEYQAIKSYAQFLEEGGEDEVEDSEEEVDDTEEVPATDEAPAEEPTEEEPSEEEPKKDELADMPEDGEEEVEDAEDETEEKEDDDDDDDDDDDEEEVTDEAKEIGVEIDVEKIGVEPNKTEDDIEKARLKMGEPKQHSEKEGAELVGEEVQKAEMESEKKSEVAELPATDDDFGISIDIEKLTQDIDKTFKDIEDELLSMGEPEKHSDKEGAELVGEDVVLEAQEETNIIIDWLFRAPKIKKTIKKATDLKIKGVEAQDKVDAEIQKRNEVMKQKIDAAKAKGLDVSKMKELARKKISDFEDTLQKRVDAADEAAKEIEDEAEEMASSNYLKRVLSKAKIEARLQVANAKMQAADKEDQVEIRDDIKDLTTKLQDAEADISDADKEISVKKKELGLGDDDLETLGELNDDLDKIKDKEAVQRKKEDDPKAQEVLKSLEDDKFKIWQEASPILDKVKDKDKKSSMFRTLTGNDEINNGAELEDYIETKQKESGSSKKSQAEKTEAEKSQAEKSQAEKSQAEKSQAEKTEAEKSEAEKSEAEKSEAEKSEAHNPTKEKEDEDVNASVDNSIYESVATRFRKAMNSKIV